MKTSKINIFKLLYILIFQINLPDYNNRLIIETLEKIHIILLLKNELQKFFIDYWLCAGINKEMKNVVTYTISQRDNNPFK